MTKEYEKRLKELKELIHRERKRRYEEAKRKRKKEADAKQRGI